MVERINREQYNGFGELFYSFIRVERIKHNNILFTTIPNFLNSYEEKKELENCRAVQRFILFTDNKNIKTITKDYKPSVFNALGGEGTW